MAEELHFDLVEQPWLPVRFRDGAARQVGLLDALINAHDISGLDIEFPTQEPPLLRLLLAICYRSLEGPLDDEAWNVLWAADALPEAPIRRYLDRWRHRFDLFHAKAPFFQSPDLESVGKDGVKPASKLIAHAPSGNNVPVFTPITDATAITLSPPEAARWLIERHAWGTASDKTGAKGNPKVRAGKDTPQIGYLAWIGFVAPTGRTLRETLLLNLIPWNRSGLVRTGPHDLPAWERPPTGALREERPPAGTCDLYTWQGRRIRLFPERRGEKVVIPRVLVCAGDDVQRDAVRTLDPHTGWHLTKLRDGTVTYSPTKARLGQQLWRGLAALLAFEEGNERAGALSWLAALEDRGVARVSLLVTAAKFGQMSTVMDDLLADRLDTAIAVLRTSDLEAATLATDAAGFAEAVGRALWNVANAPFLAYDEVHQRYDVPEGRAAVARAAREAVAEEFFGELDAPFRRLLVDLTSPDYLAAARQSWAEEVRRVATDIAQRRLARLGATDAFAGAMADGWFHRGLSAARTAFAPSELTMEAVS